MRRVLIVTPNWPPISHPDLHRARMALPHLSEFGWEPLVLKVDPDEQDGIRDPMLCATIPKETRTWQAGAIPRSWTAWFGLNSVGVRCLLHMAVLGSRIIRKEKPALVFISTTLFPVMLLGRYWRWRHDVPYVLDFQDPWRQASSPDRRSSVPDMKGRIGRLFDAILEPIAMRRVSRVVSVSPQYPSVLMARYSHVRAGQFLVLPFGAAQADFAMIARLGVRQTIFAKGDGRKHWVYVGRGGADMAFAVRAFFIALCAARRAFPERYDNVAVHFIGTDYAPSDRSRKSIEPVAVECGAGDMVEEITGRIPYLEALCCLRDADALIVLGSEDRGYSASKIYPYILANRPLLAVFHEESSVVEVVRSTRSGTAVTFAAGMEPGEVAAKIEAAWFGGDGVPQLDPPHTNWDAFAPYTARQMTLRLCRLFDEVALER